MEKSVTIRAYLKQRPRENLGGMRFFREIDGEEVSFEIKRDYREEDIRYINALNRDEVTQHKIRLEEIMDSKIPLLANLGFF